MKLLCLSFKPKLLKKEETLSFEDTRYSDLLPAEVLSLLKYYSNRSSFFLSTKIERHFEDLYPIYDINLELDRASLSTPQVIVDLVVSLQKLDPESRARFIKSLESVIYEPDFELCWSDDIKGPRKRTRKVKEKMLQSIMKIPSYSGEDDLALIDAEPSLDEALQFIGINSRDKKEVQNQFKKQSKKMQFKLHPDSGGDEDKYIYFIKSKETINSWLNE